MLLNNDIQIILHFQMEINVIMYIIEKKIKLNFNHSFGQNLNKI
jgi:hypothetical protein